MTSGRDGGRYRLTSRIATGGMGEVWVAEDTVLGREAAVKVLKLEYADDPTFRARFEAEARNAAALHHPNVASVFDFGEILDDDGSGRRPPFLVMELVPGQPLSALLRGGQPMPAPRAADVVAQAADGIAAAHAIGIVHRDVKPANLLVTPDGTVKITDFGIARAADTAAVTQTGQIVGTPHYISPEQAEGQAATAASDIYALGVVLYECLAGRRPFARDTPIQVALAHIREPVPPLDDAVPARLRAIVDRALAKSPADRFGSAADLAVALRGGAAPGLGMAPSVSSAPAGPATTQLLADPFGATGRRGAWWPWAAAAVAVAVVVLAAVGLLGGDTSEPVAADPSPEVSTGSSAGPDDRVRVRGRDHVGRRAPAVRQDLEGLGLSVRVVRVPAGSPGQSAGTVAAVRPTGLVEPGSTVTLEVWRRYDVPEPDDDEHEDDDDKSGGRPDRATGGSQGKAKGKKD